MCVCECMCVSVCLCERDKDRKTDRHTDIEMGEGGRDGNIE